MTSPLQEFNARNEERWVVLQDVPAWILDPVVDWLSGVYFKAYGNLRGEVVSQIQREFRVILEEICPFRMKNGSGHFSENVKYALSQGDDRALLLLDITVKYIRDYAPKTMPFGGATQPGQYLLAYIDKLLENGSKWKVNQKLNSESGIIERVDENIVSLAKEVRQDHLTIAWNLAFQLKPDSEKAVEEAQKAIETTASEQGLTKLTTQVYGGIIADIKSHPEMYVNVGNEAYNLHDVLNKQQNNLNDAFSLWIATTLDLIQKTHPARHKSQVVKDFSLSPQAAQQAVIMATIICWLITKQYFYKKPSKKK